MWTGRFGMRAVWGNEGPLSWVPFRLSPSLSLSASKQATGLARVNPAEFWGGILNFKFFFFVFVNFWVFVEVKINCFFWTFWVDNYVTCHLVMGVGPAWTRGKRLDLDRFFSPFLSFPDNLRAVRWSLFMHVSRVPFAAPREWVNLWVPLPRVITFPFFNFHVILFCSP